METIGLFERGQDHTYNSVNVSSHTNMRTHTSSTLYNPVTLTFDLLVNEC